MSGNTEILNVNKMFCIVLYFVKRKCCIYFFVNSLNRCYVLNTCIFSSLFVLFLRLKEICHILLDALKKVLSIVKYRRKS